MLEPGRSGAAEAMHPQDSTPSSLQGKTHQRAYQGTPSPASKVGFDNGLSAQHSAQVQLRMRLVGMCMLA